MYPSGLFLAGRVVLQPELEAHLEVVASPRTRGAAAGAEQVLEASVPAEVAHEGAQRIGEVETAEVARAAGRRALGGGVAVAVVAGALLLVAQHLVGLGGLLEALFRRLVTGV